MLLRVWMKYHFYINANKVRNLAIEADISTNDRPMFNVLVDLQWSLNKYSNLNLTEKRVNVYVINAMPN